MAPAGTVADCAVPVPVAIPAGAFVLGGPCRTSTQSAFPAELLPLGPEAYVLPGVAELVAPFAGSIQVAVYVPAPPAIFVWSIVMENATAQ